MTITSGFFNSVNGDRKYDAKRFAEYFNSFIGNGVFPNPSTNLQVMTNDDMTVTVKAGKAWINGYIMINDDDYILALDVADGVLDRIDRVVLRYDVVDREIGLEVKKGTFASSPVAPALQRDVDAYELALADIYVANGVISITQANITDQRLNSELCGIVHGTVEQVDTTTLATQYQTWFSETQTGAETDIDDLMDGLQDAWDTWFATVQEVLDGDTAGNLLNLINANSAAIAAQADDFDAHLADYMPHDSELNSYASGLDSKGIYTIIDFERTDGTLYLKSTLSNVDAYGNYQTVTWDFYDVGGTNIVLTKTWSLTYDEDGSITQKVVV